MMHSAFTLAQYIAMHRATVVSDALAALAYADMKTLAPLAHRLAGTLASFSLQEPAVRARDLEQAARTEADETAQSEALEALRGSLEALQRSLEAEDGR